MGVKTVSSCVTHRSNSDDQLNTAKMPTLVEERQLKTENGIKYIVDIKDFVTKTQTFPPGESIHSRTFHIQESSFQIIIYPNGDTSEDRGNVSVYLENRSEWGLKAQCKFSIKGHSIELEDEYYNRDGDSWGCDTFIPHSRCNIQDILTKEGNFVLEANIKLIEEEVTPNRTDNSVEIKKLKALVENQGIMIDNLKTITETSSQAQRQEIHELKEAVQSLTTSLLVQSPGYGLMAPSLLVECPVCLEPVRPPMRLMQCGHGHIVCGDCYSRTREQATLQGDRDLGSREGNTDLDRCHTCRGQLTGRPSELERILGLTDFGV